MDSKVHEWNHNQYIKHMRLTVYDHIFILIGNTKLQTSDSASTFKKPLDKMLKTNEHRTCYKRQNLSFP